MTLKCESLAGTITPVISIDEFEPKSGSTPEVIVVGIYATDEPPAKDLNRFIQRGHIDLLDAEVSPNPDEDGNYVVFVEFERNPAFFDALANFIQDIENVTGKQEWRIKPYLAGEDFALGDERVRQYVKLVPGEYVGKEDFEQDPAMMEEGIKNFLQDSYISDLTFEEDCVIINNRILARVLDFGVDTVLSEKHSLNTKPVEFDAPQELNTLWAMIGEGYDASFIDKKIVITKTNSEKILVLDKFEYKI